MTRVALSSRPVTDEVGASVLAFLCLFLGSIVAGTVMLSAFGLDLDTSLSATVTALANVGLGIGPIVGPAGNFSSLPDGAKWVLSAFWVPSMASLPLRRTSQIQLLPKVPMVVSLKLSRKPSTEPKV